MSVSVPAQDGTGRRVSFPPTPRRRQAVRELTTGLGAFELVGLAVLLLAALSPFSAPTVAAIAQDTGRTFAGATAADAYTSVWSLRPLGPANVVELGVVVCAALWFARTVQRGERSSSLDGPVLALAALLVLVQLIALLRDQQGLLYLGFDGERVAIFFAGYFLLSRMWLSPRQLRCAIAAVAAALVLVAVWLTARHGVLGSTGFVASDGRRTALLITEDTLLVGFAAMLAWGAWVDGLLSRRLGVLAVVGVGAAVLVDLLSVRRASLLLLVGVLVLRALWSPKRFAALVAVLAVTAGLAIAAGPGRSVASTAWYTAKSLVLRTDNNSTAQRQGELRNLRLNMRGADPVVGRGLGADWQAFGNNPVDIVAFGGGETAFVRVGWHIVGIEWIYKTGALGLLGLLGVLLVGARRLRRRLSRVEDVLLRSAAWSMAVLSLVLLQNLFANPRLGFFAGVCIAIASKVADLRPVPARRREPGSSLG